MKSVRGHRGNNVFLAPTTAALRDLCKVVPYLFQEHCTHSHGRDLRVVVADGHAVWAQVRTATDGGLKSNVALGGTTTPCLGLHPEGEDIAVRAAKTLGLSVAGVDLLFRADGGFLICEVNANVAWQEAADPVLPAIIDACRSRLQPRRRP